MKKLLIFALAVLSGPWLQAQNLLIANNNPGAPAGVNVFTGTSALQDAIAAANDNDIIYVVPSTTNYGEIIIDKPLTIFGIGIRPQRDNGMLSTISKTDIWASGVRISGLEINSGTGITLGSAVIPNLDGILIENCLIGISLYGNNYTLINNVIIRNNIFDGSYYITLTQVPSATVTNNLFIKSGSIRPLSANNVTFSYNVFQADQRDFFNNIDNCVFDHNIFYGIRVDSVSVSTGGFVSTNNTWNYNLAFGNSQDSYNVFYIGYDGNTGTGNIESTAGSYDPLFVNFPLMSTSWSNNFDISLQPGSPALAGSPVNPTAEDIGSSGGPTPFDSDGNLLPYIQSITMPVLIPAGNDLPVTIKAKGN